MPYLFEVVGIQCEWLFYKDIFARSKRIQHHAPVKIVPGCDDHQIDRWVGENLLELCGCIRSAKSTGNRLSIRSGAAHYAMNNKAILQFRQIRQMCGAGKVPGANQSYLYPAAGFNGGSEVYCSGRLDFALWVLEDHNQ